MERHAPRRSIIQLSIPSLALVMAVVPDPRFTTAVVAGLHAGTAAASAAPLLETATP